ncbi:bifunctional glutamate N-acetyltransferase/amino-acid acetyltransferase ArgJ [Burkholderia gladioli]|uniref:bifunctional glutamate N-acetyltransferase/amino-acid acetyltransferase ArgJ n=1 Tax=Burkholderia gladioli TaxID=28095 RepID=UPI0022CF529E|nr:bifunctional glutamate N-acetyltransferase/amino-acid acetyltransferase ArgJ [Burkholderia gladioli]MDA0574074.1 bifunctional glutamate N-acetyltransferase/amino-acid acetyltransferase ArgJ [Burkholderia gladioli]MDA0602357.1 bifunctional glutamate N-acetyltransferase/amino-acid acetyltransferase ArgJ [Burkholderia gladioli]
MTARNDFPPPAGFRTLVGNIGIKNASDDFACVFSTAPCTVSGMFSQNLFAGPSVKLSRRYLAEGQPRAVVVVSKNANVATGAQGMANAVELTERVAAKLDLAASDVLVASTGIIGRAYPMEKVRVFVDKLDPAAANCDFADIACAMMTTDTVSKYVHARVGEATVVGVAKGVGMIEPNMATMLAFFFTDAAISQPTLDRIFRKVVNASFNCLSIDTDTSTSDTAAIFANGLAGEVDEAGFEACLLELALDLVKKIARDGEGATKLLEVCVESALDDAQAKRVAKAIVNSPLVKTAIHGADPNWGRVAMAIGKCEQDASILADKVRIGFGDIEVYPRQLAAADLDRLADIMRAEHVRVAVDLACGTGKATVWGCDLSAEYIRINADYST